MLRLPSCLRSCSESDKSRRIRAFDPDGISRVALKRMDMLDAVGAVLRRARSGIRLNRIKVEKELSAPLPAGHSFGFPYPSEFNAGAHDSINEKVAKYSSTHVLAWRSFGSAWNAVPIRYRASWYWHTEFADSIGVSSAPEPEERFYQECALFQFFVSAISTIETTYFATYCLGALIDANVFKMTEEADLRFYPGRVATLFGQRFPDEEVTRALQNCIEAEAYQRIVDYRNFLSHRGILSRHHWVGGERHAQSAVASNPTSLSTDWEFSLPLTPDLTNRYYSFLSSSVGGLLAALNRFVDGSL